MKFENFSIAFFCKIPYNISKENEKNKKKEKFVFLKL